MERFVYAPRVEVLIMLEDKQKLIDVSNDIVSGSVNRRLNAMSDAQLVLQNKNGRYTKQNIVHPMDRIVIRMCRVGQPFLTFSGFVDEAPYYQIYPGTVSIAASCTLKLIQRSYFDPGLPFLQQWFQSQGWSWQPDTGTLTDYGGLGNEDLYGNMGDLIASLLSGIAGWPDNLIDIYDLPRTFLQNIAKVMEAAAQESEEIYDQNLELLSKLYGVDNFQSTAPSDIQIVTPGANDPNVITPKPLYGNVTPDDAARFILNDAKWSGDEAVKALAIAMAESSLRSGIVNGYAGCGTWSDGKVGCRGLFQISALAHQGQTRNGIVVTAAAVDDPKLNTLIAKGIYDNAGGSFSPWETYTNGDYSNFAQQAAAAIQRVTLAPTTITPSGITSPADTLTRQSAVPSGIQSGQLIPTSFTSTHETEGLDGFPAIDLMNPPGTPIGAPEAGTITRLSGHDPSEPPPLGQGGPWGLSIYYVGNASGNTYYMTHLSKVAPLGTYKKGDIIGVIGDYPGSAADHVHLGLHQGDSAEAHFSSSTVSSTNVLATGGGVISGDPASSTDSTGNTYTPAQIAQIGAQSAFFTQQFQNSDMNLASVLTGHRALANDVSIMEWIKTAVPASGRVFCSKPDGEFLAFFPDRFGYFDRTPYFYISDMEIVDLNINRNDTNLITHVFTTGPMLPEAGISVLDRMRSSVASIEDEAFKYFVNVDDSFDPIQFMAKHGAVPYQNDIVNINHPLLLWMNGWMKFTEMWAQRFTANASFTFMPELFPGGLVSFGGRVQMFLESVSHTFDMAGGFSTNATLSSLAVLDEDQFPELGRAGDFDPQVIQERFN